MSVLVSIFFFFFRHTFGCFLLSGSRIHERTISLRFLGIIWRVLSLEVSVHNVYITNQFQPFLFKRGGGSVSKSGQQGGKFLKFLSQLRPRNRPLLSCLFVIFFDGTIMSVHGIFFAEKIIKYAEAYFRSLPSMQRLEFQSITAQKNQDRLKFS